MFCHDSVHLWNIDVMSLFRFVICSVMMVYFGVCGCCMYRVYIYVQCMDSAHLLWCILLHSVRHPLMVLQCSLFRLLSTILLSILCVYLLFYSMFYIHNAAILLFSYSSLNQLFVNRPYNCDWWSRNWIYLSTFALPISLPVFLLFIFIHNNDDSVLSLTSECQ